ncbi:MAG: mechanosensitive ion channel protein [Proteobacteria bacterium]|nr:MAG: mechanosensitive ion channel protein [Pseudomonadota bacterium]
MLDFLNKTAFTLSDNHIISWLQIVYALGFLVAAWFLSRLMAFLVVKKLLSSARISQDSRAIIQRILFFSMIVVVLLTLLAYLGIPLATFAFISGAVAIGFGFGAKTIIENFLSGWILMSERPIRIGDIVEMDGLMGRIISIGNRSTLIKRNDGADIVVPNSQVLESRLVNWTLHDPFIRISVRVGVAYGSDVGLVKNQLEQVLQSYEHAQAEPAPVIVFEDFADSALIIDAFFWVSVQAGRELRLIRSDVRFLIDQAFREQGIVIAFPQRDVHVNFTDPGQLTGLQGKHND